MIQDRGRLERSPAHSVALDCIEEAIRAADPATVTLSAVTATDRTFSVLGTDYDPGEYDEIVLVGGGKAAVGITTALEARLGQWITDGLLVSKASAETAIVRTVIGDHPLPSRRNVDATTAILELADLADEDTLFLFVLTGGASALLSSPAGDLSVSDLRAATRDLLESGVPIEEANAVRKHLSTVKGGRLARRVAPASVAGLVLSDVVGNDLSTIGSGPTVPDETTFAEARAVFERNDIDPPSAVLDHLDAGIEGRIAETPFEDDPAFETVENHLIGNNGVALDAARTVAKDAGYEVLTLSSRLQGEARELAGTLVAVGEEIATRGRPIEPPAVVLGGGESTVTIAEEAKTGGPNQELVLSGGLELDYSGVLAAVDTDGEDGSSEVAGAIVDDTTVTDAERAREHLVANDAGSHLEELGATIRTGRTGTNVNDVIVLVVPERDGDTR